MPTDLGTHDVEATILIRIGDSYPVTVCRFVVPVSADLDPDDGVILLRIGEERMTRTISKALRRAARAVARKADS